MGTKRVGLARTQALIQGLKRDLDMQLSSLDNVNNLTVEGIQLHTNASGKYVNGRNTVIKTATADASTELKSGAIYVPAGSLIRSITVVITTALTWTGSKSIGVRAGTSSGNATYCALVVDSLYASATSASATAGKGTSSDAALTADLSGNSALALGANFIAAKGEIHVEVQPSTADITTGAVAFIVEFDYLGGN
tara:strand:- start:324 stop:908 length:585 start_codon:yes stop_codon:yes gene_type:complete